MARKRRIYTREFKLEAIKLVAEKGYSVSEAARSLAAPTISRDEDGTSRLMLCLSLVTRRPDANRRV